MPTLDENMDMWDRRYDWPQAAIEWSAAWGDTETQWYRTLLPRIYSFIPARTILEIAPGFGRWTEFLAGCCERLILVDLSPKCIRACRDRFGAHSHISYYVNDGTSLDFIPDGSVDVVFSFDSLVHAEEDVIVAYLSQLARKLSPEGVGIVHHSNLGEHAGYLGFVGKIPYRLKKLLSQWGVLETFEIQWRARSMSASRFEHAATRSGLQCVGQEIINWQSKRLIDCISVFVPKGSARVRANRIVRNADFMREATYARRLSRLYGRQGLNAAGTPS